MPLRLSPPLRLITGLVLDLWDWTGYDRWIGIKIDFLFRISFHQ